ncbi:class III lanthionine synthetase LanKC [Paenibacillus sp. GSMTC-2017]|uniref:class III lanthionine synthetase LanKC n=1 Tax=Paenibacillus sp. GSMTC-2017 TaxID=2794350 RepID=UPI0018D6482F|nr:class III lanthionine synthetase LanKC [Paenibacillus sp. GSMTC-2017]MBH5318639.1 class III lanthionine synthetase LanKC [Paenibacillus sp. GSMTC-2017]
MEIPFRTYLFNKIIRTEHYESLDRYIATEELLQIIYSIIPEKWTVNRMNVWFRVEAKDQKLPQQGWKIHISVIPSQCQDLLRDAATVLFQGGVAFKFLCDTSLVRESGGNLWNRSSGGKFMTVYPASEDQFHTTIEQLHLVLQKYDGPYILSDRRYKNSKTVYYQYGLFEKNPYMTVLGDKRNYFVSPDGDLNPKTDLSYFDCPSWTQDPFPSEDEVDEDQALNNGRYRIESMLSNTMTGGVYLATDMKEDRLVVVKEARPHTQMDEYGHDATYRLQKEYEILQLLAKDGIAPAPVDLFQDWEHTFLVEEHVKGSALNHFFAANMPFKYTSPSAEDKIKYLETLKKIWTNLARAIAICHKKNVVCCNLSITNVIVLDAATGQVKLVDLEAGHRLGMDFKNSIQTIGFSDRDVTQTPKCEDDIYSLGAIMAANLFPVNCLYEIDPGKKDLFVEALGEDLGVPMQLRSLIRRCMSAEIVDRPTAEQVVCLLDSIHLELTSVTSIVPIAKTELLTVVEHTSKYIVQCADYHRTDRLFPADPLVFETNPLNLAYGAAGVVHALQRLNKEVPQAALTWILARSLSTEQIPPGLYTGMAGIAWVLLDAGLHEPAARLLRKAQESPLLHQSADIFTGSAGYGLTCIRFYMTTGDQHWLDQAIAAGEHLLTTKKKDRDGYFWKDSEGDIWHGYTRGSSGIALFLLYLGIVSKNDSYMNEGKLALAFELGKLLNVSDDILSVRRGKVGRKELIMSESWHGGAAGIAAVLIRYWAYLKEPSYLETAQKLARNTSKKYSTFPALFKGLSGSGNLLLDMYQFTGEKHYLLEAHHIANGIMLFKLDKSDGIAFPGEQLMKISTDYATGSAGIALFLHRLANENEHLNDFNFTLDELLDFSPSEYPSNKNYEQLSSM